MQVFAFMQQIETLKEFDSDKKTTKVAASDKGKKKPCESDGSKGLHNCVLHGKNNAHNTSECEHKCETLPASVQQMERPVRAFAPRKGHPSAGAPQSGAGAWQLV